MKYLIIELQVAATGDLASLTYAANSRSEGDSIFYQKCAAAAISGLNCHSVAYLTESGMPVLPPVCYRAGELAD